MCLRSVGWSWPQPFVAEGSKEASLDKIANPGGGPDARMGDGCRVALSCSDRYARKHVHANLTLGHPQHGKHLLFTKAMLLKICCRASWSWQRIYRNAKQRQLRYYVDDESQPPELTRPVRVTSYGLLRNVPCLANCTKTSLT